MSILAQLPMKFECRQCNKLYLHQYQQEKRHYPHCPSCQKAGLLLGIAELQDLIKHPLIFAASFIKFKPSSHKLNTSH
ncbi:hypothetical protein ABFP25_06490 [Acinetobacter indicus]|jgi:NAD-dependent SIR2 family protein deacetylase|uniref:Uncharacterized protein n=3 Tax=Moraxellaceae TaxID=468 RepID=V2UIC6_9GAMM|nr:MULTISPECIES: hypothetical protein [Acinetobacter]AVH13923.1 hypothetical protein CTZ23_06235 [Acinetobacter indicus]ENW89425.1 hypothetical protein F905_01208 [Acinetobacter sp. CIP 53.82]EPF72674.1 hypothetical protein F956_01343 [Acinetobacter indicus ANC 4215]ESK48380.1 hypothetical protein P253_01023 [Acinetobacter indicus CIP 110367]MBA0154409.1 hypothetical protein [Acinetobacter indicus]